MVNTPVDRPTVIQLSEAEEQDGETRSLMQGYGTTTHDVSTSIEMSTLSPSTTLENDGEAQIKELQLRYHKIVQEGTVQELRTELERDISDGTDTYERILARNEFEETFMDCLVKIKRKEWLKKKLLEVILKSRLQDTHIESLLIEEDSGGHSAIERAAFFRKLELLKLMVERYSRIAERNDQLPKVPTNKKKRTLLHSSACAGHLEICKYLLDTWPDIIDAQDIDGLTALHMASSFKHSEVINFLIEQNASLGLMNKNGEPALVYAMCSPSAKDHLLRRFDGAFKFKKARRYTKMDKVEFSLDSILPPQGLEKSEATKNCNDRPPPVMEDEAAVFATETQALASVTKLRIDVIEDYLLHAFFRTFVELKMQRIRILSIFLLVMHLSYTVLFSTLSVLRDANRKISESNSTDVAIDNDSFKHISDVKIATTVIAGFNIIPVLLRLFFLFSTIRNRRGQSRECSNEAPKFPGRGKRVKTTVQKIFSTTVISFSRVILKLAIHSLTIRLVWTDSSEVKYLLPFMMIVHWCWLVVKLQAFQYPGKYAMMIMKVLRRLCSLLLTYVPIYIGFVLALSLAFRNEELLTFPAVLVTGFSMMQGEHNTKDFFENPDIVPFTSHVVFVAFLVVLGLALINLLIGLTVADIALLKKESTALLVMQNIDIINDFEEFALWMERTFSFPYFVKQLTLQPNRNSNHPVRGIELSLKECDKADLLYEEKIDGKNFTMRHKLKRKCAYYAYFLAGVVFYNSSLYRQYPIDGVIQDLVEDAATRSRQESAATRSRQEGAVTRSRQE